MVIQSKLRFTTELLSRDTRPLAGSIVLSCRHGPGRCVHLLNCDWMRALAKRGSQAFSSAVSRCPL